MRTEFLESAVQEFYEAIAFYNIQRDGLGEEFEKEVRATIERIKQNPEAWAAVFPSKWARRCLTNRFPYGIIYQTGKNALLIVAVWHLHRRPQAWRTRLSNIPQ